jgi:hypothetical protein
MILNSLGMIAAIAPDADLTDALGRFEAGRITLRRQFEGLLDYSRHGDRYPPDALVQLASSQ